MKKTFKRILSAFAAVGLSLIPTTLTSCGGGGSNNEGPAPFVLNGTRFNITSSWALDFISVLAETDVTNPTVESGIVLMSPSPGSLLLTDPNGATATVPIAPTISNASYTYQVTSGSTARLTVRGFGANSDPTEFELLEGEFEFTVDFLYASSGGFIDGMALRMSANAMTTGMNANSAALLDGVTFNDATLRLQSSGGLVPEQYGIDESRFAVSRSIVPPVINRQRLVVDVVTPAASSVVYQLLQSQFTTPLSNFDLRLEQGQGSCIDPSVGGVPTVIDWSWQPGQNSAGFEQNNLGVFTSVDSNGVTLIYDFIFADLQPDGTIIGGSESGTFTRSDGATGTFNFPFLDNFFTP